MSQCNSSSILDSIQFPYYNKSCYEKRILIVDDQSFNINALIIILKHAIGIDPTICDKALNGLEALDKIINNVIENDYIHCNYELILMDCNMPFMDGYEAAQKIR